LHDEQLLYMYMYRTHTNQSSILPLFKQDLYMNNINHNEVCLTAFSTAYRYQISSQSTADTFGDATCTRGQIWLPHYVLSYLICKQPHKPQEPTNSTFCDKVPVLKKKSINYFTKRQVI